MKLINKVLMYRLRRWLVNKLLKFFRSVAEKTTLFPLYQKRKSNLPIIKAKGFARKRKSIFRTTFVFGRSARWYNSRSAVALRRLMLTAEAFG